MVSLEGAELLRGMRILLPRAEKAREVLPEILRKRGATVDVVMAYRTVPDKRHAGRVRKAAACGLDAVVFTSGSAVENLLALLPPGRSRALLRRTAAASIGPVTTAALRRRGFRRILEAEAAAMEDLCRVIARHFEEGR